MRRALLDTLKQEGSPNWGEEEFYQQKERERTMNMQARSGVIESIEQSEVKTGQYGPYANFKLRISGEKFSLPFVPMDKQREFNEGDEAHFMFETKTYKTNDGKDIPYNQIDKKTFKCGKKQETVNYSQPPSKPSQTIQVKSNGDDNRQVLIVAQSSLERALTLLTHNFPQNKVNEDDAINLMKKFANAILRFEPLRTETAGNMQVQEDEIPF